MLKCMDTVEEEIGKISKTSGELWMPLKDSMNIAHRKGYAEWLMSDDLPIQHGVPFAVSDDGWSDKATRDSGSDADEDGKNASHLLNMVDEGENDFASSKSSIHEDL